MSAQVLLHQATGLNLTKKAAERAVRQRIEQLQQNGSAIADEEAYLAAMTPAEMTQLVELVVVPESWLFRDAQAFVAATEFVKARLAAGGARARLVRLLSIPCAGGEEPYSMAMSLRDAGVPDDAYTIDAFDLSPGCVARAQEGVYGRNAFRAQDIAFRDRYFTHLGDDEYRIDDKLRRQVNFKQGNLLEFDTALRARHYDVIFCRNLLIYFDKPTTAAAIGKLSAILADDGLLFAGYAEVPSFCQNGFTPLQFRQAFGLKKDLAPAQIPGLPAAAPPRRRVTAPPAFPAPAAVLAGRKSPPPVASAPARPAHAAPAVLTPHASRAGAAAPVDFLAQARRLADQGHFKDAAEMCQAHLAVAPDSADAYFILGILSEHGGKMTAAEDYWRRCIYLQPDHYDALCHLALLAEQNGNQAGAASLKARAARVYQRRQA
jgi:chemotaxis protein methyltransferase WspC